MGAEGERGLVIFAPCPRLLVIRRTSYYLSEILVLLKTKICCIVPATSHTKDKCQTLTKI